MEDITMNTHSFDTLIPHMKRAGLIATALAAVITAKFGWAVGEDFTSKVALAGLLALCTFIVGYALVAAYQAYTRGMYSVAGAAVMLFAISVFVEFTSHTGFTAANRDATIQNANAVNDVYKDGRKNVEHWTATVERLTADRSKMQPVRTAAQARAAIDSATAHKFYRSTDGCKTTKGPQTRAHCDGLLSAQADLTMWDNIAVADNKIEEAQAKLETVKAAASTKSVAHASGASQGLILASMATGEMDPSKGAIYWAGLGLASLLALFAIAAGGLVNFIAWSFDEEPHKSASGISTTDTVSTSHSAAPTIIRERVIDDRNAVEIVSRRISAALQLPVAA
jgi:hypothetical protein